MLAENSKATDTVAASLSRLSGAADSASAKGVYTLECRDAQGNLKWSEVISNLVVNQGLQDMNAKYFTGSSYTAAWYIGLYGAASSNNPAAGDTMSSHGGWTEVTDYSEANRVTASFAAATNANPSVVTNTASKATFTMNGSTTVGGAFLTSNNTKGGTTGTLFSAADFQAPGDRTVVSGDILSVTYTFSLSA